MGFMTDIVEWLNEVAIQFYEIYLEVLGWPEPFWRIYAPFYFLYNAAGYLAWNFHHFGTWVNQVVYELTQILSWGTIWSYILSYVPNLEEVRDWFYNITGNILSVVYDWWAYTQSNVQGWIAAAVAGANQLQLEWNDFINSTWVYFSSTVNTLSTQWNDFINTTLPGLVDFSGLTTWWDSTMGDVMELIDSAFVIRESLWAGWQDMRNQVVEFFTDPLTWLESGFTDWFLGAE